MPRDTPYLRTHGYDPRGPGADRATATSASAEFDRLLTEATDIAGRIAEELANGQFPAGLHWGHVGDMAETVKGLRAVSDRMFAEGEHAEPEIPDLVGYLNER